MNNDRSLDISEVLIDPTWTMKIQPQIALRRLALPICLVNGHLVVAMSDTSDQQTIAAIESATGKPVETMSADPAELRQFLLQIYGDARTAQVNSPSDDPVALVDSLLRAAVIRNASDIHFAPERDSLRVRMRIDGLLEDFMRIPNAIKSAVTSRLKIMGALDIAERRAPQDGAFVWQMTAKSVKTSIDVRIATLPVRYGERLTLRLLESGRDRLTLQNLGLNEGNMRVFQAILEKPHGLVLITGPTGSGKTTTLYAAIREILSHATLNILTVEDPIEYEIEGVSQAEVDSSDKVNFAKALRSLLRHDPDVIMIGEIRDTESLDTAVKAALTGHLVLATLHTNDAISAITRLTDMGLAPHKIAATLRLSAAQRLTRLLCPHCRQRYQLSDTEAHIIGRPDLSGKTAFRPKGCLKCAGRGFRGRTGLFELMAPDDEIASMIAASVPIGKIVESIKKKGFRTMCDDIAEKILQGVIAVSEIAKL